MYDKMFRTQETRTNTLKGCELGKGQLDDSLFSDLITSLARIVPETRSNDHHSFIAAVKSFPRNVSQKMSLLEKAFGLVSSDFSDQSEASSRRLC